MSEPAPSQSPKSTWKPSREVCCQIVDDLCGMLPKPSEDTAEARARRDHAAFCEVADLQPANTEEARLAARYVAAGAYADDCLQQARMRIERPRPAPMQAAEIKVGVQLGAQYASMLRASGGARSLLLRVQAARGKREAAGVTASEDAAVARATVQLMSEAREELAARRPAPAAPETAAPVAAAPPISPEERKLRWEADVFAIVHTQQSRLIRRLGGLPAGCGVENPEQRLLQAILTGNGSNQQWADEMTIEEARMNAGLDLHLCRYDVEGDTAIGVYVAGAADAADAVIQADTAIPA